VIKYADDEGDFVTVSSDEEVKFAIENSKGLLRLSVDQPKRCSKPVISAPKEEKPHNHYHRHHDDSEDDSEDEESGSGSDENPRWRHKNKHNARLMENPAALEKCLQRLKQKRQKLQEKLVYLDSAAENGNLGRGRYHQRDKLRRKVGFLSARIERLTEAANKQPSPVASTPTITAELSASGVPSSPQPAPVSLEEVLPPSVTLTPVVPQELSATTTTTTTTTTTALDSTSGSMPNKATLQPEIEALQNNIVGLKLALRQADLQLQLHRTKLQAATHRQNDGAAVGPQATEAEIQQLKDALGTAKANQAAAKADLKAQVNKLHQFVHQLQAIKQTEKAEWRAAKLQEKAARKAEKMAKRTYTH